MAISLKQIEAFRAVMIAGTMVLAGQMLRISQPAVSRLIAELERQLGYDVFIRARGRLQPTEEGRALFAEVERAFVGLNHIENAGKAIGQRVSGTIRVVAMHALGMRDGVDAIARYCRTYEDVDVIFDIGSRQMVLERIGAMQADIGIATLPVEEASIHFEEVLQEDWMCLVRTDHPLAQRPRIHAQDLKDEPFISFSGDSFDRVQVDSVFEALGVPRRLRVETRTGETACNLVAQGAGISVLPRAYAPSSLSSDLVFRPFVPTIPLRVGIVTPAHIPLARRTRLFRDILRQEFSDTITQMQASNPPVFDNRASD